MVVYNEITEARKMEDRREKRQGARQSWQRNPQRKNQSA
ncbi:hypothetical protein VPH234P9_0051 [Vibrio phage 234P9]